MPIPIQTQLFDAFLGEQEAIHSIILPDIFSSGGSKNLFIDKFGRAKKISGYVKQNSSAIVSNGSSTTVLVRALFPYKATGAGTTVRQLLAITDDGTAAVQLWYSTNDGSTWTFVYDWGVTAVGQIPTFVQFGDACYITVGKLAPRVWQNTTLSATALTQSPTPSSALDAAPAGNLNGNYQYKLLSMVGGVRQYGSAASASLSVASKQVDLTWSQDANASVTGYEIYRTSGTGQVFYFLTYLDGRGTVSFTDNIGDLTILQNRVMIEHGDAPPVVYYATTHKQRVWWARTDANPTRAFWSDPGLAQSVLSTNFLDFSDSTTQGDVITGVLGDQNGQLVIWTEKAVWTVSGTGTVIGNIVDWTRTRTNAQIGSVSGRTVVRIPAGAKYSDETGKIQHVTTTGYGTEAGLAYLTPLNDIRFWDGQNDIIISYPKKTTLSTINYANRQKAFALLDHVRDEVTWVFPTGSSVEPNTAITWNYRWGIWYTREWPFAHACESENSSNASLLLSGSNSKTTGGFVYKLWSGNSFNGAAINAVWMTKGLFGVESKGGQGQPAMTQTKRWRFADFLFETEQTTSLLVEWLPGNAPDNGAAFASATITPSSSSILSANGDTIISSGGDTILLALLSSTVMALLKNSRGRYLSHTGIRLRISDNSATGSWSLEAMNLGYQILPGYSDRMQIGGLNDPA